MAQNSYKVGDKTNKVTINVVVSTPGTADSEVFLGGNNLVTQSTNATGVIPTFPLGTGDTLKGITLEADTDIELDDIPDTEWPAAFDNLVIKYFVNGGADGAKVFTVDDGDKKKSTSGKTITVEKFIKFS